MTPAEQLQIAMASLDLSKPEDLRKLAGIQQATGDLAGAAQTASKITAMEQAKIAATYAANQEARSALGSEQRTEAFKISKDDRLKQETKDAALLKRQIAQQTRSERSLVLQEEASAREKKRSEAALTDRDTKLAQEEGLRTLYETQARSEGREELADAIKDGLDLAAVGSILYTKTSTAAITAPKGAEKVAFEKLLASPAMQDAIPEIFQDNFWGEWGKTSDEADDLIFYKLKAIRQREGNNITVEDAMLEAIKEVAKVLTPPAKGLTPEEVAAQAASLNTGSVAPDGSTDGYGGVR
tara:strand:- start:224 stop:1117 length:894 start_codon:yes stop_codon:yes gene_type:complete